MSYKIVRYYQNGKKITLHRGLTEEEAQEHCENPETSSTTCTKAVNKRRTKICGPWFEGYTKE